MAVVRIDFYILRGGIEWPEGCSVESTALPADTKERVDKTVAILKITNS